MYFLGYTIYLIVRLLSDNFEGLIELLYGLVGGALIALFISPIVIVIYLFYKLISGIISYLVSQ